MDAFWRGGGRPLIKRQTSVVDTENESHGNNNNNNRSSSASRVSSRNINDSMSASDTPRSPDIVNLGSEHSDESCNGDVLSAKMGESVDNLSIGGVGSSNRLGIDSVREPNSSASSVSDDAGGATTPSHHLPRIRPEEAEKHFEALDTILCPLLSSYSANDSQMSKCSIRRKFYTQTYMHYPHSISLGKSYGDLARALRTREVIQLTRDYVMRIGQVQSFIYTLQRLAIEEHCLLLQKRKTGQRVSADDSRVDCVVAICDDMRGHVAHWTSLTNKLLLSHSIKCYRWRILQKLQGVRKQLHYHMQVALWWLAHLINSCIHVFAITPFHQIPDAILWNITRGVEEFGIILDLAKSRGLLKQLHAMGWCNLPIFNPQTSDCSLPILSITNRPSLAKLLNEISKSRSTLVAELVYEIFSSNDTIVELINLDKQSDYKWSLLQGKTEGDNNEDLKDGITIHLIQKHVSSLLQYVNLEESFATQILTSLSTNTNMLRKTNLRAGGAATGAGGYVSPRNSSAQDVVAQLSRLKNRRSSEASHYFQESSFSIDIYKPKLKNVSDNQSSDIPHTSSEPNATKQHTPLKSSTSEVHHNSSQNEGTSPVGSGQVSARKPRKSVKWNDSATSSTVNHFKTRYLNLLWMHLKETLSRKFREPNWTTVESSRFCLGDVRLLSTTAIMFVSKSLHHLSNDDGFGDPLRNVIQHISKSIHCIAVNIFTEQEFRRMLVSTLSDRSILTGLGTGDSVAQLEEVSSPTKLVIGALRSSISLAECTTREQSADTADLTGVNDSGRIGMSLWNCQLCVNCSSVLPGNLVQCCTLIGSYSAWFSSQISQSTLNWNVQSYINLAHIDLIMVKELVARHLIAIETLMSSQGSNIPLSSPIGSNPNNPRQHHASPSLPNSLSLIPLHITATQLKQIQQGLHLLTAESEKLWLEQCEVICKAHWQKSFPLHKVWKTRGSGAIGSTKPQEYAQRAIVSIVEPVARAAAPLRVNSQVRIVGSVLRTLFHTWMDYILQNRVRFTVVGAYQLSVDFDCIQKWISCNFCQLDPETVAQLGLLHIFREASAVIAILQDEQPTSSSSIPPSSPQRHSQITDVKTKSANSLLDVIDPSRDQVVSDKEGRNSSGTASAPILREWDTNRIPSLDKRRKLLSGSEYSEVSANQKPAVPFGNFFAINSDAESSSNSVCGARKNSSSHQSDISCSSTSAFRIPGDSGRSGFVHVNRADEWESLRAGSSLCPMSFGIVPFLCTDTEN